MNIRDRIIDFRRVPAASLRPNPKNWRTHPQAQQDALRGVLAEVGYVDALLARELPDGTLMLIDGHLRAETTPEMEVPVLVVDLDEAEAAKMLATFDPLSAMAETNAAALDSLLREVQTGNEALAGMLTELAGVEEQKDATLSPLVMQPPPVMAWVLIGVPIERWEQIATLAESATLIPGVVIETTANNG